MIVAPEILSCGTNSEDILLPSRAQCVFLCALLEVFVSSAEALSTSEVFGEPFDMRVVLSTKMFLARGRE